MPLLKKAVIISLFLIIQSGTGILGATVALDNRYAGVIQQGIAVKGIPLDGLNQAEAAKKLQSSLPAPAENALELKDGGKSYLINLSSIDGRYDYLSTAGEAMEYSNSGKLSNQLISVLRLLAKPVDLPLRIAFSEDKLAAQIKNLQGEWEAQPKDAEIGLSNGKVVIVPEKAGYSLDYEKTLERSRLALATGNLHAEAAGRCLEPDITAADLEGIDTLLAEYVTTFDNSAGNRSHNIDLASRAVNGSLLKPGEMFSLNKRLGPRLAETGYLKAPVFIDNRLAQDIGGGVCQVATTLYNAVLLSDLKVVERYSHPSPVSYVSPGRDATIAGDYLDLKFINNTDTPVYISSQVEAGTLTVRIFGAEKNDGRSVRIISEKKLIEPQVVIVPDNTLAEGETKVISEGKPGYEARVYREVFINGRVESKTQISSDYYQPEDKIIHVGPKPEGVAK
jgi:vancomycin resistance protein YoaR